MSEAPNENEGLQGAAAVANTVTSSTAGTIKFEATFPDHVRLHMLEDHQLDQLANVQRPISLAIAGVAAGAFVSLLPSALGSVATLGKAFGGVELAYVLLDVVTLLVGIFAGIVAWRAERDVQGLLKDIRGRGSRPIDQMSQSSSA